MKYLSLNRPPVDPNFADLMAHFFPNQSYWTDVEGNVKFVGKDGLTDETIEMPPQDEWERVLSLMNEEWEVEKKRIEVRQSLPTKDILLWNLWKDIDSGTVPGKGGLFHQSILDAIHKYSEGQESVLYPYDDYE